MIKQYFNLFFKGVTVESNISVGSEDTKYKMLMRGHENPWYESVKITCRHGHSN